MTINSGIGGVIGQYASGAPDAYAIQVGDGPALTYAMLVAQIERTRRHFNAHGIGCGDRVALVIGHAPTACAAYLATICSAVAVPINPDSTAYEFERLLRNSNIKAAIVPKGEGGLSAIAGRLLDNVFTAERTPNEGAGSFKLSGGRPGQAERPGATRGEDIASIQTSSGTTGTPKSIPLLHDILLTRVRRDAKILGLSCEDVTINFRPPHLSGPLNIGLLASICNGGSVVVPVRFDADEFFADLNRFGITWYTGGPAYHRAILDSAPDHHDAIATSRLRFVRSAGYALPANMQADIEATFGVPCVQKYGSSEAGLVSCNPLPPDRRKPGTSGPVIDCEVRLIATDNNDARDGEAGEILVRGPAVFAGYDDPEMTAAAFLDGWFRTGDMGTIDKDGYLSITGRRNEIINRGGQKISPLEVEEAFSEMTGVAEVLCFPIPHTTLGSTAGIAVVPRDGIDLTEDALRTFAVARLARYKVPETIVVAKNLPRGASGKPLRRSAAGFFGIIANTSEDTADLHPPTDWLEQTWCEILRIDVVHDNQNFTRAGGDSLRAMRFEFLVEDHYGITLPPDTFYGTDATLAGLRSVIAQADRSAGHKARHSLEKRTDPNADLPLTSSQQRLWSICKLLPNVVQYNSSMGLRFAGAFNMDAFRRAANTVAARHEALRACFPTTDGLPVLRFLSRLDLAIEFTDISRELDETREKRLHDLTLEISRRPYDLENGPLFRLSVVGVSDSDTVVNVQTHHIISDANTSTILCRELNECYEAFRDERPPDLPPIERTFGDFVKDQTDRLAAGGADELINYWLHQIEDVPTIIEIPTDKPRPPVASHRGNRFYFQFSPETGESLRKVSAESGATPSATLLSAFEILVSRMTGQDRFVIGSFIDTRPPQFRNQIVGFGINTIPIPARIDPNLSFRDHSRRKRGALQAAWDHSEVPFDVLVRHRADMHNRAFPPLVQIAFGFMPKGSRPADTRYSEAQLWNLDHERSRFDITMMLDDTDQGISGFVEYATDIYEQASIQRMISRYRSLLEEIIKDAGKAVSEYNVLPDEERSQIETQSTGPVTAYPRDLSIQSVFRETAKAHPEITALMYGDRVIDYRTLDRWSDAIAQELVASGVVRGDVVGLSSERTPAAIAAIFGILKSGAVYLPLDPRLPPERIGHMSEDARARLVLLQEGTALKPGPSIAVHHLSGESVEPTKGVPLPTVSSRDLAYLCFTSGSTGRPKGVEVEHRSVLQTVINTNYFDVGLGRKFAQTCSLGFDVSVFEIFASLLNGATLVIPEAVFPSINDYADMILDYGIETVWFTSGLFREMVDYRPDCFSSVKQIIVGGDMVPCDHARRLVEAYPSCTIVNGYGPTENTTFSVCGPLDHNTLSRGIVPIGTPIANSTAWILNDSKRLVPLGTEGDLYVGGDGVARGYRGRPDLTAKMFGPDPFSDDPDARLYFTGDRARFLPDGRIDFLGRKDLQIKIRGFRVELGEIETVLRQHPGVLDAVAFARRDGIVVKSLAAAVIAQDVEVQPSVKALRAHLGQTLPEHMIPTEFGFTESFPLNASGKIDRSALARLTSVGTADRTPEAIVAPRTPIEELLFDIWARILKCDDFGIDEGFFALGGSSLQVMQLGFLLAEETGIDIPQIVLFTKPTIRRMAEAVFELLIEEENESTEAAQ